MIWKFLLMPILFVAFNIIGSGACMILLAFWAMEKKEFWNIYKSGWYQRTNRT